MKAIHTKECFEKYRAILFDKYEKECNYEYRLSILLPDFSEIPEDKRKNAEAVVTKMYAEMVATDAKNELLRRMRMINEIKASRASLGYTTVQQEVSAWHDLNEGFEFSCFMLAEFKKKYGIA